MTAEKQIIEGTFKVGNREHFNNRESKMAYDLSLTSSKLSPNKHQHLRVKMGQGSIPANANRTTLLATNTLAAQTSANFKT